jgi:hypothetical protein
MSLLSLDLTKKRQLPLSKVEVEAPQPRQEPVTPIPLRKPPSEEEQAYTKLLQDSPHFLDFVDRLDLVSEATGERIKLLDLQQEPQNRLRTLSNKIFDKCTPYSRDEALQAISGALNINQDRALAGLEQMLQAGAIEQTPGGSYYLGGSTPF